MIQKQVGGNVKNKQKPKTDISNKREADRTQANNKPTTKVGSRMRERTGRMNEHQMKKRRFRDASSGIVSMIQTSTYNTPHDDRTGQLSHVS